jgi:hypothetical protein
LIGLAHHLLIDVDSKIPNLALMKISAWAKARGDSVDFRDAGQRPDHVWISCVFTWNKEKALGIGTFYPDSQVHYGGTGFDWGRSRERRIELPREIAAFPPDYDLYLDERAVGFCQRGCNRKCQFCDVWRKEGRIAENEYVPLRDWVPGKFRKVILLDNDMALYEDKVHDEILQDAIDLKLKLCISQGYDIRCITKGRASLLASHKPFDIDFTEHRIYIAWDYLGIEGWVRKGIEILLDAGFKGREIYCYMICGFNTTHEEDLYRYRVLREDFGVMPYVMPYNRRKDDEWLNHFARFVNRGYCNFIPYEEYKKGILVKLQSAASKRPSGEKLVENEALFGPPIENSGSRSLELKLC